MKHKKVRNKYFLKIGIALDTPKYLSLPHHTLIPIIITLKLTWEVIALGSQYLKCASKYTVY